MATINATSTIGLLGIVYAFLWARLCYHPTITTTTEQGINARNPVIDLTPAPINIHSKGSKDVIYQCGRVPVSGISRLQLQHYANVYRVTLVPSELISKQSQNKIQVCFHRNSSLGLCQCEQDDWRSLNNGIWSSTMATYEHKFVDVKFNNEVTGSVTVSLDEVQQRWRWILLAVGIVLMFVAPVVSEWVPFYYAGSMAIGILAVVLILLYQARKLLPTGRRNTFYLAIMSLVLGMGSFVVQNLSAFFNSFLQNFGINKEVQSPLYVFVVVGIIILGAGLGYWLVPKYIISEDGKVDIGVAQFIKWSLRIVAVTCIFLSTNDTPLAMVAVGFCSALCHLFTEIRNGSISGVDNFLGWNKQKTLKQRHVEFLRRSKKTSPLKNSVEGNEGLVNGNYYSTFHKTPDRKEFSKNEWEEFTDESTRKCVAELTSSPEFTDWVMNNADRIKLLPEECSDESVSGYTDELSGTGIGFFNWQMRK